MFVTIGSRRGNLQMSVSEIFAVTVYDEGAQAKASFKVCTLTRV
jgi:hypothetical protein